MPVSALFAESRSTEPRLVRGHRHQGVVREGSLEGSGFVKGQGQDTISGPPGKASWGCVFRSRFISDPAPVGQGHTARGADPAHWGTEGGI